jgi:hypothetical protein
MSTPDPIGGNRYNPNTPEGQIEGMGNFARGLVRDASRSP